MTNPLVAQRENSTQSFSGVQILESVDDTKRTIESGDWAAGVLGVAGTGLEALGMAMDPLGAIFAAGVGWLMEHVGPLSAALDSLTGDPDEIKAHSETWKNISAELADVGAEMTNLVKNDTATWIGTAGDAYRARSEDIANLIAAAKSAADGASSGIATAGEVVAAVRTLVRDIIAELVGHAVSWALQVLATLGIALAWVVPQLIAEVAKVAAKIADITMKLMKALKALSPMLKKLGDSFGDTKEALDKIKSGGGKADGPKGPAPTKPSSDGGPKSRSVFDDGPAATTPSSWSGKIDFKTDGPGMSTMRPAPREPQPEPTQLMGITKKSEPRTFDPSKVKVTALTDAKGNPVGVTFQSERDKLFKRGPNDVQHMQEWVKKPKGREFTYLLPKGETKISQHLKNGGQGMTPTPNQQDLRMKNPFIINAHSNPTVFELNVESPWWKLKDDKVYVDGDTFAKVAEQSKVFRDAVGKNNPNTYQLQACSSGKLTEPGGSAYDFQKALSDEFRKPVYAPSEKNGTFNLPETGSSFVENGGQWRRFSDRSVKSYGDAEEGWARMQHQEARVQERLRQRQEGSGA
jgi:uncharacterized protein YukE